MNPNTSERPDPFPSTKWTIVRLAVAHHRPGADQALDRLCRSYEGPILAYILNSGVSPNEAEDLKQGFFENLLAKESLASAEESGVKLRVFLLAKLRGFLIDRHRRAQAQKRGGGRVMNLSDLAESEARLAEPVDSVTPFIAYQRRWIEALAANAMATLRAEYVERGHAALFDALAPFITRSSEEKIPEISAKLGRPEGTLKSDISRLRVKCQQLIRHKVAATLDDPTPENIESELAELMGYRG
jgi:DNA-directed RNA polymerase specialized sigma24 family protein